MFRREKVVNKGLVRDLFLIGVGILVTLVVIRIVQIWV